MTEKVIVSAEHRRNLPSWNGKLFSELLQEEIARYIKTSPSLKTIRGKTKFIALIGPTGVGKTTTLAKIAAKYFLEERKRVTLLTADTYRIAATQQLRSYGDIMGIPVEIVESAGEMREAAIKHSDKDIILLDTAGRSPQNSLQISELKELFKTARIDETHLLIGAGTKYLDSLDIIGKFGVVPINRLLFTKVDETKHCGAILDICANFNLNVTWLTTGQSVPYDIELADKAKLAKLIMGE